MTEQSFLHCPATLVNTEGNYQVTGVRIYGLFPILSKTNIMYSFSCADYFQAELISFLKCHWEGEHPMPSLVKQVTSLLLVLCSLLITSCAPTPLSRQTPYPTQLASPITRQTPQQLQLTSSAWEPISLPATNTALLSSTVSPDNPSTIYACTSASRTPGVASSIALWQTHDAGQHWSSLPIPKATGTDCSISLAPSLHQRVAVLITDWCSDQPSCTHNTLYFSTDSGTTWQQLSLATTVPHGATITQNEIIVADRHLYLWYSYGIRQDTSQHSLLVRSDDDGLTWSRIDSHVEPHGFFLPPQIGQDELLVLSTRTLPPANPSETLLWTSHDAGSSWRLVGTIPPPADNFLLFSQPPGSSWPTPQIPLYALGAEQLPSDLYELKVLQSTNGQHWSLLPPLPVPGTSVEHPGLLQALAVTGDGDLLAFGPDPKIGLPSSLSTPLDPIPTFWLWIWNPRTSTWQVLSSPLAHPAHEGCGLCWSAQLSTGPDQSTYLYVHHWEVMNSFFRVRLPSLPAAQRY